MSKLKLQNTPPEIWLLVGDEHEVTDAEFDFSQYDSEYVCWCVDQQGEHDIRYIRADVHDAQIAQQHKISADLSRTVETRCNDLRELEQSKAQLVKFFTDQVEELRDEVARIDKARSELVAHIESCKVQSSKLRYMGEEFEESVRWLDAMAHAYRVALEMLQPLPPPPTEETKL